MTEALEGRLAYGNVFHPTIPVRFQLRGFKPERPATGVVQVVMFDPQAGTDEQDAIAASGVDLNDPFVLVDPLYLMSISTEVLH